jgi:transposase-like protein
MARPTKYNAEYHCPWAEGLTRRGATNEEIAEQFGVAPSTIYEWANAHEEFSESLKKGKEITDMQVEKSLLQRALGYSITEKKTVIQATGDGANKPARIEVLEKEIPPDTTACIFWLKNRNPKLWRDKRDMEVVESDDAKIKEWIKNLGLNESE